MARTIAIDPEVIAAHAARVERVAAEVGTARDAAASTNMAGGAFGVMCSFMVPPANEVAGIAREAIAAAEKMIERSAVELRGVATDAETAQADMIAGIESLGEGWS